MGSVKVPARLIAEIAIAFFSVFSSSNNAQAKAQAEIDVKREQHLAAKNKSDEFGYDYKNKISKSVNESLNQMFDPTLEKFTQFSNQFKTNNMKLLEHKENLQNVLKKLGD